ncbi:MAG: hypothetical protein AB8B74_07430 [Crocinitomicaceae bacterium]
MKLISCFFVLCLSVTLLGQDFSIEYKTFLLQPHFKSRHIKSLTIKKSSDSLFNKSSIKYKLQFDTEGRLTKLYDYYFDTDTIPERLIEYTYGDSSMYYSGKTYFYLDENRKILLEKGWSMEFDNVNNVIEEKFHNKLDLYRTNTLIFNKSMQVLSRKVRAFAIKLETYFKYNADGMIRHVKMVKHNPTVEKMKRLELNQYLQYNLHQKIMTTEQWLDERGKQINEYFYNYKGQNISARVGWRLMNWSNDEKKLIERTNFFYDQYGLLIGSNYFTERQVSNIHKYEKFEYTFYSEDGKVNRTSDRFTTIWYTDLFAENLIHP